MSAPSIGGKGVYFLKTSFDLKCQVEWIAKASCVVVFFSTQLTDMLLLF